MDTSMEFNDSTYYNNEDYEYTTVYAWSILHPLLMIIYHFNQILLILSFSITFILGTAGNGLVIWITSFKMKTVSAVWFLNLAIAHFIFCANLPFQIMSIARGWTWPFGKLLCKANFTILFLNMFSSISFLTIIIIDRCASIVWPLWAKKHRTPRLASCISMFIWVLALVSSVSYPFWHSAGTFNISQCYLTYPTPIRVDYSKNFIRKTELSDNILITRIITIYIIPFCIIITCYRIIVLKLSTIKRHNKSQWPFRVITPLVVSFFACWFPYHVFALIKLEVTFSLKWLLYDILRSVSVCLAYFNSCLNPILYVFIGKDVNYKVKKPILSILENAFSERFILRSKEIDHTTDTYV